MEHDLKITSKAFERIKELMDELSIEGVRIYIQGGGCSGFSYGFDVVNEPNEDDIVISSDGVQVMVDPMSMMYLMDATVDYKKDLMNEQFTITNPAVKSTCGCGSSFSMS